MADGQQPPNVTAETFSDRVVNAMIDVLKTATSPEMMQAQQILMRRLALAGDLIPSRMPAARNITEVGGYLNLLETTDQPELRAQVLASVLGVAGPNPPLGWIPTAPALFYATRPNDRPAGPAQAAIPVEFSIRSDFATAFDAALKEIHDRGCALPMLSPNRTLPQAVSGGPPPSDLLRYIGRTLELVPSAALIDPDNDPLALARITAGGDLQVVSRQRDPTAPNAAQVPNQNWTAWKCDAAACQEVAGNRTYLSLATDLNAAGWYQPKPTVPASLAQPGSWARWTNITGLVSGVTRFADELGMLFSASEIATSSLRERLAWKWNGIDFTATGT